MDICQSGVNVSRSSPQKCLAGWRFNFVNYFQQYLGRMIQLTIFGISNRQWRLSGDSCYWQWWVTTDDEPPSVGFHPAEEAASVLGCGASESHLQLLWCINAEATLIRRRRMRFMGSGGGHRPKRWRSGGLVVTDPEAGHRSWSIAWLRPLVSVAVDEASLGSCSHGRCTGTCGLSSPWPGDCRWWSMAWFIGESCFAPVPSRSSGASQVADHDHTWVTTKFVSINYYGINTTTSMVNSIDNILKL